MSVVNGMSRLMPFFSNDVIAAEPKPWQIGFQPSASPIMEGIAEMHNLLIVIITCIAIFVTVLMAYVIYKFRASKNPVPSANSHNTLLEIVWTLLPVMILIVIGIPSLKLMFFANKLEHADITVKAIGHQWYWSYQYPEENLNFDSLMIEDKDIKPGQLRLLSVDNPVVVPAGKTVRVIVTSEDVLHSFAVPSLGIKKDAVPGRINETWFRIEKEGEYYGQCSELCGVKHGFMPIAIKVISPEKYNEWVNSKKVK